MSDDDRKRILDATDQLAQVDRLLELAECVVGESSTGEMVTIPREGAALMVEWLRGRLTAIRESIELTSTS